MRLHVLKGPQEGHVVGLTDGEFVAGREPGVEVHLPSRRVSRRHCVFQVDGLRVVVRDLGSANGIVVNGQRVEAVELTHGSRVQVGDCLLALDAPELLQAPHAAAAVQQAAPAPQPSFTPEPGGFGGPPRGSLAPGASQQPFASGAPQQSFAPSAPGQSFAPAAPQQPFAPSPVESGLGSAAPVPVTPEGGPPAWSPAGQQGPTTDTVPKSELPDGAAAGGGFDFGAPQGGGFGGGGFGSDPHAPMDFGSGAGQQLADPHGQGGYAQPASSDPYGGGGFGGMDQGFGAPQAGQGVAGAADVQPAEAPEEAESKLNARLNWAVTKFRSLPWRVHVGMMFGFGLLFFVLSPIGGLLGVKGSADSAMEQVALERGVAIAESLGHRNASTLIGTGDRGYDMGPVKGKLGVKEALIIDARMRTRAPPDSQSRNLAKNGTLMSAAATRQPATMKQFSGRHEIAVPVRASRGDGAPASVVGFIWMEYDAGEVASEAGNVGPQTVAAALLALALAGGFFFGIWKLAVEPVARLREDTELALRGHLERVDVRVKWAQLEELAHSINRTFQRVSGGPDRRLPSVLAASPYPIILLEGVRVNEVNDAALYVLQKPREQVLGKPLTEVVADPDVSAKLSALLQAIAARQAPVVAESAVIAGAQRRITMAGEAGAGGAVSFAVVVIA